jgi:hypothetical protein
VSVLALLLFVLAGGARQGPAAHRPAHAQGNIIYVNDDARGANSGSSWANAYTNTLVVEPPAGYAVAGATQHTVSVTAGVTTTAPGFNLRPSGGVSRTFYLPALSR